MDYVVNNGDLLIVNSREILARSAEVVNIYEAIAQLQKDVLDLEDKMEMLTTR